MPIVKFDQTEEQSLKDSQRVENELKQKNEDFHIGFILDESSSMATVWQDTISGFNYYLNQLRSETPEARLTFASFVNSEVKVRSSSRPIDEVLPLNTKSYTPYGSTPLVDSVMRIIALIEQQLNIAPGPGPTIVVQTDGNENASLSYTMSDLNKVIKKKREEGWRFILLTCAYNPNTLAQNMGIDPAAAVEYGKGKTREAFKTTARLTTMSAKTDEEVKFSLEDKRRLR